MVDTMDPRTGQVTGTVPDMGREEVADAIERARKAQRDWAALSVEERADHLGIVSDLILERADDLAELIAADNGKTPFEAVTTDLMATVDLLDHHRKVAPKALAPEKRSVGQLVHKRAEVRFEPMGVVGVISPWNYPFILSMAPLVTALFGGNTVVLKPSEHTPLVGVAIGELFAEAATRAGEHGDIVQVVTGAGETGDALVRGGIQKVAFTGSAATGRKVMAAAAETLTPVLLELGGKDPMIVCADAHVDRAARGAVWGAFQNSGQTCISVERVYVEEPIYDEFVERVLHHARKIRQGVGPGHDIGAMTVPSQVDIVEDHIADAVSKGARVLMGANRGERAGLWFEPTVLVDVDHTMKCMTDETFGPTLPIMKVASEEEAIRLANDTRYGLNSSVWTSDPQRAERLAGAIEAGNVCHNDAIVNYGVPDLPFGGVKESGMGRIHGEWGLREFTHPKSVLYDRGWVKKNPLWYPTSKRMEKRAIPLMRLRYGRGLGNRLSALRRLLTG